MNKILKIFGQFFVFTLAFVIFSLAFLSFSNTIAFAETTPTVTPVISTTSSTVKINTSRVIKLTTPRMKGDDVKALQTFLNNIGYNTGTADGVFGPKTQAGVKLFQTTNKLTPDGLVGPKTKAFISNILPTISNSTIASISSLTEGCNGINPFNTVTGQTCIATQPSILPIGCKSSLGFSTISGVSCSTGLLPAPVFKITGGGSSGSSIRTISNSTISGVTIPAQAEIPTITLAGNTQYTATISWAGTPSVFLASTSYTAVITITPKDGYTLTGVPANFFTVAGATATNFADTGVITAVFPATPLKQLTISAPTITTSKAYNSNTTAIVSAGTLSGIIGTEDVTVSAVATYDNKNIGTGKTITVVYTLGGVNASNYIKPSDYTVTTGVITSISLTISNPTLTTSKQYDRTTTAIVTAGALSGIVGGDDVVPSAVANYDTLNIGTNKTMTVVYTISGADAGNYIKPANRLVYSGVISQKQLTISNPTLTTTKLYDQNNSAVVSPGTLSGVVDIEDVSIGTTVATYDNENVGSGKTITVVYTITGADSANYIKPVNYITSSGIISSIQLTISNPTLTISRQENGTTQATVIAGSLTGVLGGDTVTVSAVANYNDANVGTNKTITTVYTLGGAQMGNYTKPINYVVTDGVILVASTISNPAISGITVPILGAIPDTTVNETAEYTATISWNTNPTTFGASTIYTAVVTIAPKTSYTLTGVNANFFSVAGATTVTNSINSGVVTIVFPATLGTANYATPSAVALAPGTTNPVGQAANSFIPLPNGTNATGVVNSWASGTKDSIKFTVTDTTGVSTITINGSAYTSGADYILTSTATPTIVVTTTEGGKLNGVYTFTIAVSTNTFIGDSMGGGKVAYILQPGDTGYNASVQHGLIASTADISSGIRWWNGSNTTTGATATAIGTGLENTDAIIANQGITATSYAAGLARAYNGGGYTDWYLPSKDELNKLYLQKTLIGGFSTYGYWSSSEVSSTSSWVQYFGSGGQGSTTKDYTFYVRAVRAF